MHESLAECRLTNITRLGYPFTKGGCNATTAFNNYIFNSSANQRPIVYKRTQCIMQTLTKKLVEYCGCYLPYISDKHTFGNIFNVSAIGACNFKKHGVCASYILSRFKWKQQQHCKPACHSFKFNIESIHVSHFITRSMIIISWSDRICKLKLLQLRSGTFRF